MQSWPSHDRRERVARRRFLPHDCWIADDLDRAPVPHKDVMLIFRITVIALLKMVIVAAPRGSISGLSTSPADDYVDRPLDFNELLIVNPAPTFAVRVIGDSMMVLGLFSNFFIILCLYHAHRIYIEGRGRERPFPLESKKVSWPRS